MRRRLRLLFLLVVISSTSSESASSSLTPNKKPSLVEAKLPTSSKQTLPSKPNQQTNETNPAIKPVSQLINNGTSQALIRVDSKSGKLLARMQGKRQTDATEAPSRRNEDPWFLDQTPYPLQPYRFVYNIKGKNGQTEQYRQEVGDGKFLTGSYGYVLPDGIYRHVDYIADDRGFRAFIRTSEPGTANQNPANVVMQATPLVQPPGQVYSSVRPPDPLLPAPLPSSTFGSLGAADVPAYGNFYQPPSGADSVSDVRRPPGSIVNNALSPISSQNFTFARPSSGSIQPNRPSIDKSLLPAGNFGYLPPSSTGDYLPLPAERFGNIQSSGNNRTQSDLNNNWRPNSISDELAFARINNNRQLFLSQPNSLAQTIPSPSDGFNPRRPAESSTSFSPPVERSSQVSSDSGRLAGQRLAYDTPLSVQGNLGPYKLSYDNNHVFHPNLPYLSLERARSLAQINQLNAITSPGHHIRPFHLSSLPTAPNSLDSGSLGLLQVQPPIQHFSSHSSSSQHSKQEEHEHRHQVVSSSGDSQQQPSSAANSGSASGALPTAKEHRSGSGSVREFEHHQTTNHGLPPPPQPTFSGQSTFQSRPPSSSQETGGDGSGGVKGGGPPSGNGRLLAPYASLSQQQQQRDEHLSDAGGSGNSGAIKGGPVEPAAPQPPSPPAEPSAPASPAPTEPTTPRPSGPEHHGSVKGGSSSSSSSQSSSANEREKRRPQEPFAWFNNNNNLPSETDGNSKLLPLLHEHKSSLSAPVRSIRMPGEMDYRSTVLMNDLRSMQNMIGLPQPPRLSRQQQPAIHQIIAPSNQQQHHHHHHHHHLAHAQFRPTNANDDNSNSLRTNLIHPANPDDETRLNSADRIVSARMSRLEALMERANQLQRQNSSTANSSGPTGSGRAASVQQASIAQIESPLALQTNGGGTKGPSEAGGGEDQQLRSRSVRKLQPPSIDGPLNELEDNLVRAANESFDARRLSQAKRLQAEKVSELEKFQQRLRAQQLFLEHSKSQDTNQPAGAGKLVPLSPGANSNSPKLSSSRQSNDLLNSHVKYDEDNATDHQHLLKPHLFKSLEPSFARDFPRIRRQPEQQQDTPVAVDQTKANSSSVVEKQEDKQQQRQRKLTVFLQSGVQQQQQQQDKNETAQRGDKQLSEFARQIKRWPSIVTGQIGSNSSLPEQQNSIDTSSAAGGGWPDAGGRKKLPANSSLDEPTGGASSEKKLNRIAQQEERPSMNFLNSVASLSAHQLNPFSLASVNLQQPRDSPANSTGQGNSPQQQPATTPTSTMGVATSSARYFSSPELLAALDHHEQRDTGGQLRSVLLSPSPSASSSTANIQPTGATQTPKHSLEPTTLVSWATNHRYHRSAGAPYVQQQQQPPHQSAEQANIMSVESTRDLPQRQQPKVATAAAHQVSRSNQEPTAALSFGANSRDGFDIRSDRSVQLDDERFYEVVSSSGSSSSANSNNGQQQQHQNQPTDWAQFQAFRDAQLSIPALAAS